MGVRRGIVWAITESLEQSKDGFRHGKRINKQRFSRLVLLLAVIFLFCFAVLGLNVLLQGKVEVHASSAQEVRHVTDPSSQDVQGIHTASKQDIKEVTKSSNKEPNEVSMASSLGTPPRSKRRKQHFPCEIGLRESVDYILEPVDYMHLTKFSLQYVEKEEAEPRFAGHQTLNEREKSFYATDQILPCGFVQGTAGFPSSGFDLDAKDKMYMSTCKVVVSSCIFGSSDFLRRPTSRQISEYSKKNVCFVMFVDEQTLSTLVSDGNAPDDRGNVGLWRIVLVKNLPYKDMRRTGKVPKFLSHRLFPSSRYSIWLDSKMRLNTDPMLVIEYFLWRTRSEYAISNHYDRHCVWEEVLQNKRLNKYNHTAIDEQFMFYQSDGLVKFDPTDPKVPLPSYVPEGSFIVRAHTPMSNLFSCLWFNEVDRFTSRDQLSFAYTYLKLRRLNPGRPFRLYMFKDCERRAIVKLFHHREFPPPPPAI